MREVAEAAIHGVTSPREAHRGVGQRRPRYRDGRGQSRQGGRVPVLRHHARVRAADNASTHQQTLACASPADDEDDNAPCEPGYTSINEIYFYFYTIMNY